MTEPQKTFLAQVYAPALQSEQRWSIPAPISIAQAILESATKNGWGTSPLYTELHNPFGIKATQHAGDEPYTEFRTAEYHGEHPELERARFVEFASLTDAFNRHGSLFWTDRYERVRLLCRATAPPYTLDKLRPIALAIMNCGYSTRRPEIIGDAHPNYADELLDIVRKDLSSMLSPAGAPEPESQKV